MVATSLVAVAMTVVSGFGQVAVCLGGRSAELWMGELRLRWYEWGGITAPLFGWYEFPSFHLEWWYSLPNPESAAHSAGLAWYEWSTSHNLGLEYSVGVLVWPLALATGLAGGVLVHRGRRAGMVSICPTCGYSLVGLTPGTSCPECGKGRPRAPEPGDASHGVGPRVGG